MAVGSMSCLCLTRLPNKSRMFPGPREAVHNHNPVGPDSPIHIRENMKLTEFTKLLILVLILTVGAQGCRKRPGSITPLPGRAGSNVPGADNAPPLTGN